MPDPSIEDRLARIRALLDELAANEEDARQEILVAVEQLLDQARQRHANAVHQHREIQAQLSRQREERRRRRG